MNNLEKLIKFLLSDKDILELSNKMELSKETTKEFCLDIIQRIIPDDFTKYDNSHIEEKDFRAIVANFNLLLKEENLRPLMINGVKKYGLSSSQVSSLVGAILPLMHSKIQVLTKSTPEKQVENVRKEEVKEEKLQEPEEEAQEVNEIFSSISKRAEEDEVKTEEKSAKKSLISLIHKKKVVEDSEVLKPASTIESAKIEDDSLNSVEKICIWVVLACLLAIIVLFAVVLIIINF